jgi:hypothetical protein
LYQEVDDDGEFDRDGLATLERTIQSIKLPYEFDGETLKIRIPASTLKLKHGEMRENARTRTSKFFGYACTVTTEKMNSVFSEEDLMLYNRDTAGWKDRALTWFHKLPVSRQTEIMNKSYSGDYANEKLYNYLAKHYGILIKKQVPLQEVGSASTRN